MKETTEIRAGERLNEADLREYPRGEFSRLKDEIEIEQFPAGNSNPTYLIKIAVIVRQIYFRFANGFTSDKRFASFDGFVNALGKIALRAVETEKI